MYELYACWELTVWFGGGGRGWSSGGGQNLKDEVRSIRGWLQLNLLGRKGESNGVNEGMAARVEKGILHAFGCEFPLPEGQVRAFRIQTGLLQTTRGLRIRRSEGAEEEEGESLPSRSVSCGDQAPAAGRGGTAGGAESTALSLRLACSFLSPSLRPPALSSPVDVAFPSDTKPASYPGVAA